MILNANNPSPNSNSLFQLMGKTEPRVSSQKTNHLTDHQQGCEHVLYHVSNNCAFITFNRPEKMNSLHRGMLIQISNCLEQAEMDQDVRLIVLKGHQKAFCTGQDLGELLDENPPSVEELLENFHDPVVQKITRSKKPVIAAVNGVAAGAGAVFAMACDIVIASDKASFIFGFSQIGLTSGSGGTYFLTRKVGTQKAAALLMLGEKINAQEAERIGMIYKVVAQETFDSEIDAISSKMAQLPAISLSLTKQLVSQASENDLDTQILLERDAKCFAGNSPDFAEGVNAFISKRKPVFNQNNQYPVPAAHVTKITLKRNLADCGSL